jgi:hypothetical protein
MVEMNNVLFENLKPFLFFSAAQEMNSRIILSLQITTAFILQHLLPKMFLII